MVLWKDQKIRHLFYKTFVEDPCDGRSIQSFCAIRYEDSENFAPFLILWILSLVVFFGYFIIAVIHSFRAARSTMSRLDLKIKRDKIIGTKTSSKQFRALIAFTAFLLLLFVVTYAAFGTVVYTAILGGIILVPWTVRSYRSYKQTPQNRMEYVFMVSVDKLFARLNNG